MSMSTGWIDNAVNSIDTHLSNLEDLHASLVTDDEFQDIADSVWEAIKSMKNQRQNYLHIKRRLENE